MKQTPPNAIQRAVALLIPPACREHVLGDLYERNQTKWAYILDAIGVVPYTIWSQIRRTTSPQLFLSQAAALSASFLAAACLARLHGISFFGEPTAFIRLAIPVSAALTALLISDTYVEPESAARDRTAINSALALGGLTQAALFFAHADWVLPQVISVVGTVMSWTLVIVTRAWLSRGRSRTQLLHARPGTPTAPTEEAPPLQGVPRKFRLQLMGVLLFFGITAIHGAYSKVGIERIPLLVMTVASLYSAFRVYRLPQAPPDTVRVPWRARRDLFLRWYNAPILAILIATALEQPLKHPEQMELWPPILPLLLLSFTWYYLAWTWSHRRTG